MPCDVSIQRVSWSSAVAVQQLEYSHLGFAKNYIEQFSIFHVKSSFLMERKTQERLSFIFRAFINLKQWWSGQVLIVIKIGYCLNWTEYWNTILSLKSI